MLLAATVMCSQLSVSLTGLPLWNEEVSPRDWLLGGVKTKAGVFRTNHPNELVLANGLVARKVLIKPHLATVALENLITKESLLRAVKPEAEVVLDGKPYAVGGLIGQPDLAYLTDNWLRNLKSDPDALQLKGFEVGKPMARMAWKR